MALYEVTERTASSSERERACGEALVAWFERNARDLPWRRGYDPYRVLVSEFMLQQTQVRTVLPYFERWTERWPNLGALARADESEALKLWEGLGYYSRCRNLLKCARAMTADGHEAPPSSVEALLSYPGIGPYTAGAVASLAYNRPVPAVDGNAERVTARFCDLAATGAALKRLTAEFVSRILDVLPPGSSRAFNQALMDLGATVCVPAVPLCGACPLAAFCLGRERGVQAERPVPAAKIAVRKIDAWGTLCLFEGAYLLRRRPDEGLWAGMWEAPWFERWGGAFEGDFDAWARPLGLRRLAHREVGAVSFSFTANRVRAWVVVCEVEPDESFLGRVRSREWGAFAPGELEALALPAPSRKFLAASEGTFQRRLQTAP